MKKFLPLLFIIGIVTIFFRQFFLNNLLPIPSDTIVGLYHPFRDLYVKDYPRGIPFKNFLITDPVRQQIPWRMESIRQEKILQLPLWNPYNFVGTPLLANQQSAVFNPLNLLFFVLAFPYAWSILILLQPVLGGIFLFLYLRQQKISVVPSLLGSTAFIFSGFFVSWLEWGTIDMTAIWLPLILLSIDKIFLEKKYTWYVIYFLSNLVAFFAGHLQTFIYLFVLAHAYMLFRIFKSKDSMKTILVGLPLGIVAIVVSLIQLIPLIQFIFLSGRNADLVIQEGWFIPWQHLITFLVPDFFGNPTTLNYWGVWNYAELAGYMGIIALFFAVYGFFEKLRKLEWFFLGALLVALVCALPTPIAQLPLLLKIPFLSTAQPTRLLFIVDFSLSILAAFGMQKFFINKSKKILFPLILFVLLFAFFWSVVIFSTKLFPTISISNMLVAKHNLIFPTAILGGLIVLLSAGLIFKKQKLFVILLVSTLLLNIFDVIRFADKFTPFTANAYLFPKTNTITFLQKNLGNYRYMTTDSEIFPPNFSLVYHLQSVDGYDPLYIRDYGELVAALGRGKPDIQEPFGFNRIITPHTFDSPLIDLLGVKYVLSLHDIASSKLQKVFQEGETRVYENKQMLPRAFFVQQVQNATSSQEAVNFLFENNLKVSAVAQGIKQNAFTSLGVVSISRYSDNQVVLQTQNDSDGFLVLTDAYYPTWHAFVDDKEVKIYRTDLALRGIFVSKGTHTVTFAVQLF